MFSNLCDRQHISSANKSFSKTKIEKGTPFKRNITKAIEQISKFIENNAKNREKNLPATGKFFFLLLALSSVNFDVCSIAFVMFLLIGVFLSIFVLIRNYCTPLSLDGFPNATTSLSLSFGIVFCGDRSKVMFKLKKLKSVASLRMVAPEFRGVTLHRL